MPEEIKQDVVLKTQKYLGKYVKKPPLSEKLLKKPPFRFLHDIVNTVIKETGFLKGLYTEEELISENVKEREGKVAFLHKLIDAVKAITNTDLAVRPSKIVAGLEPTETNILLQTIGKALEKKLDSSEYVKNINAGQNNDKNKKVKKPIDKNEKNRIEKIKEKDDKVKSRKIEKQGSNETPKSTDREKTKVKRSSKESKNKGTEEKKAKTKEKNKSKEKEKNATPTSERKENDKIVEQKVDTKNEKEIDDAAKIPTESTTNLETVQPEEKTEPRKRSASASRPKSARPKSGDVKEKEINDSSKEKQETSLKEKRETLNLKEKQETNFKENEVQIQARPKSSLRPPSVRPSSARPGAPRLRPDSAIPIKEMVPMGKINVIVESFDKDGDEEETVVIQSAPEIVEERPENVEVSGDNKGHLVEQILEQIGETGDKGVEERQTEIFYGKDAAAKDMNNLRTLIQSLTKTANPLGKLLNYLHEDIEAMHSELEMWSRNKKQLFQEIAKQKKINNEMNKPLLAQLEHLNSEIKKVEEEVVNSRHNILKNDAKIRELLSK